MGVNSSPSPPASRGRLSPASESGQSLVLIVAAMAVVLLIAAAAIDVADWYQTHHHAQVTADAAALGAANYMSGGGTSPTATTKATGLASANGIGISPSDVSVDTTANNVTVTVPTTAPGFFEHLFGSGPSVTARAVAHWSQAANAAYSLFAGNTACGAGLGIDFVSNGGGSESVYGLYSNGQYVVDANSNHPVNGAYAYDQSGGTYCSGNTTSVKNGSVVDAGTSPLPFPQTFSQPSGTGCTYSASYFTTSTTIGSGKTATTVPSAHRITGPGVYCVTSPFDGASCTDDFQSASNNGWIFFDGSSMPSGGYEFVASCVSLANLSSGITSPSGAPLVYGTSNTTTAAATPSGSPTCTAPTNGSTSTYLDNNGATLGGTIYDQCGTVEITGNNTFEGFIEAANIKVDKNNSVTGTGPTAPYEYGSDALSQ